MARLFEERRAAGAFVLLLAMTACGDLPPEPAEAPEIGLMPLATIGMVLIAISFVFGSLREATMGYRVFVAMGIGLVFTILQRLMEPASLLFGISPFLAVLIPILICGGLGLFFLQRTR